jgi:plasmid stability protein
MARGDPELRIRLPEELRDLLSERAAEHRHSMNAEVVAILSDALKWQKYDFDSMADEIKTLREEVKEARRVEEMFYSAMKYLGVDLKAIKK